MRSVFFYLWQTTEDEVAAALDVRFSAKGRTWTCLVNDDPRLYIDFYRTGPIEEEDWNTKFDLRGPPSVCVMVDISGRHEGWQQTQDFALWILGRFEGVAEDDDQMRFWSRYEIQQDMEFDGRHFGSWRNK